LLDDADKDAADLWLVNTCTVKNPSQQAMASVLTRGRQLGKKLVVAGCVPQGDRRAKELQGLSLLGARACSTPPIPWLRRAAPRCSTSQRIMPSACGVGPETHLQHLLVHCTARPMGCILAQQVHARRAHVSALGSQAAAVRSQHEALSGDVTRVSPTHAPRCVLCYSCCCCQRWLPQGALWSQVSAGS
jgi:hypothetical protein